MPSWRVTVEQFHIERVGPSDNLDDIVALEAQSFSNPWPREILARELADSAVTRMYVLRTHEARVVAFCLCWVVVDELHINTIAVDPAMRRQGLATRLMRHVFSEAAAAGVRRATLEVRRSNAPAIALYEQLGFAMCAVRPRYYNEPDEDALILWREGLDPNP
jgi:[ribosomal protein S18]-alanine N-acetyltransferase